MSRDIPESNGSSGSPTKVLACILAAIIGGIGWLALLLGSELWQLARGVPLVFLAAWLVRTAIHNDA